MRARRARRRPVRWFRPSPREVFPDDGWGVVEVLDGPAALGVLRVAGRVVGGVLRVAAATFALLMGLLLGAISGVILLVALLQIVRT